jgi:hypothetical protein
MPLTERLTFAMAIQNLRFARRRARHLLSYRVLEQVAPISARRPSVEANKNRFDRRQ